MHLPCNLYRQRACKNKDQLFHKIESYNIVCATTGSPTLPPRICRLLANYDGRCVNHRLRYDRRPGRCRLGPALSLDAADLMHTPSGSSSLFLMLDSSLECNGCSKDCTVRISFSVLVIFVINGDADDIRLPEPLGLSVTGRVLRHPFAAVTRHHHPSSVRSTLVELTQRPCGATFFLLVYRETGH